MRLTWLVLACVFGSALGVDRGKFRTCEKTSFCRRQRSQSQAQSNTQYYVHTRDVTAVDGGFTAHLRTMHDEQMAPLELAVEWLRSGSLHVTLNEGSDALFPRYSVQDVIVDASIDNMAHFDVDTAAGSVTLGSSRGARVEVDVSPKPFQLRFFADAHDDTPSISVNSRSLLMFEQYRERNTIAPPELAAGQDQVDTDTDMDVDVDVDVPMDVDVDVDVEVKKEDTEGMWQESFGKFSDSKPRGPASVGVDIRFHSSSFVYGIPSHATSFALPNTRGDNAHYQEPYRLYNLDVFEFELDEVMALYGSIPFMVSHGTDKTVGAFWLNAAETYVDVEDGNGGRDKDTHWMSESGVLEFFLLPGASPREVSSQYAALTGKPAMPQMFAASYHQCRWNYRDEADVAAVQAGFEEHDIPYDVLWLDIEHTDSKKYFTWDSTHFPNPADMQNALAAYGHKTVTIVDPHMKRDNAYPLHQGFQEKGMYIKDTSNKDYEGWCWPGSVSYPDFTRADVREHWASHFSLDKYPGSTSHLFTWNDMNEPSVFDGPEVSMPKDNLHQGNIEHRDVHNLYGMYVHMATYQGQLHRDVNTRPFVLSRAFFAGTQRYGAVWTGDNMAEWSHLKSSTPMLLAHSVAGLSFIGADVGGFFGDPDAELLTRWYQVAAYQPFFRGHAHIDAKRREPWVFGEPWTARMREAIRSRYQVLPYLYTLFQEAAATGVPIMRPLWYEFPRAIGGQQQFLAEEEVSFMLGNALLVHTVSEEGQTSCDVQLPGQGLWYDVSDGGGVFGAMKLSGSRAVIACDIDRGVPVLQRGGTIVPRRVRMRRSSEFMWRDPISLVVALDAEGNASGSLYLDDGRSFRYLQGESLSLHFSFRRVDATRAVFTSKSSGSWNAMEGVYVERVVVLGDDVQHFKQVYREESPAADVTLEYVPGGVEVRRAGIPVTKDVTLVLTS